MPCQGNVKSVHNFQLSKFTMTDFSLYLLAVAGLLFMLLLTLALLVIYSGVLSTVNVSVGKPYIGDVVIAYKFCRGAYSNSGSAFCESTSINPEKVQLGLYYDNPDVVPQEKLRYAVGAIISSPDGSVDKDAWPAYEAKNYKQFHLPKCDASVNSSFPYVNAISIIAGVYRVYPMLNRFVKERTLNAWPYLEIYDKGLINYMGPLDHQRQFLVPEAAESWDELNQYYPENHGYADTYAVTDQTVKEKKVLTNEDPVAEEALPNDSDDSFEKVEAEN